MSAMLGQPDLSGDIPQGLMMLTRRLRRRRRGSLRVDQRSPVGSGAPRRAMQYNRRRRRRRKRIPLIARSERKELLRHLDDALGGRLL